MKILFSQGLTDLRSVFRPGRYKLALAKEQQMRFFLLIVFLSLTPIEAQEQNFEKQLADAESAFAIRNFREAIEKFQPLLSHFEEKGDRQRVADICFKLGRSYRRTGNFDQAHAFLKRALDLHSQIGDSKGTGFDLSEIAIAHQRQGNYEESLTFSHKALTIHQQNNDFLGIARTLDNFGNIYYRKGDFEKALENFEPGVDAASKSGDKETLSVVLSNLGQVYMGLGEYPRALEIFQQSQHLAGEINDTNSQATNLANSALVYWNLGDLKRAITDLVQSGELFAQVGNEPLVATNFVNQGMMQYETGNYMQSLDLLQTALRKAEELNDKGLAAAVLNNLSTVEREIGDFGAARDHAQRALRISTEIGEKLGMTGALLELGRISKAQHDLRSALQHFQNALRIDRETGYKKGIHLRLRELGIVFAETGELDRALASFEEAAALQQSLGATVERGFTQTLIASVHRRKRNLTQAETALKEALPVLQEANVPDFVWPTFYNYGLLSRDQGRIQDALQWMREAIRVIENLREGVGLPEERSSYLESRLDVYESIVALLVQTENIEEAFEFVQRSKSRAFLDLLSEHRIDPQADLDPAQYDEKRKMLAALIRLNRQIKEEQETAEPNQAKIAKLKKKRTEMDAQYIQLMRDIRKQNSRFAELQDPEIVTLSRARDLLDDRTILLDYFLGHKEGFVFAIARNEARIFRVPNEQTLGELIPGLLEAVAKPEPHFEVTEKTHTRYIRTASSVFEQVLLPAQSVWRNKKRFIIAADGPLHYVPFELLLTETVKTSEFDFTNLPYFALNREIQYIPSISALAAIEQSRPAEHSRAQKAWLAFADPIQGKVPGRNRGLSSPAVREWPGSLSELPYSRLEVQKIAELYPSADVSIFMGKDATEQVAKTMPLGEFRVLHFASHGLIDEERPQLSALLLNPGNPVEDGYLTMREVFDLKLNADLVVLSACRSGLGKQRRGEGITGIARAFLCAGATTVLVSLWNVNDRSTADFMTDFYRSRTQRGLNKAEALQQARLQMIRSTKYSHPYYWGPFVLIGAN